ncbi:MAG: hypothetical protein R8J85_09130 [Mariprofundales bacterium]
MTNSAALLLLGLLLPLLANAAPSSSASQRGLVVAQVRCQPCHFLTKSLHRIGPGLLGIYNRAPSIVGVPFKVWDDAALEQWLTNPRAVKINTPMYLPPLSARDRRLIIAWLRQNH